MSLLPIFFYGCAGIEVVQTNPVREQTSQVDSQSAQPDFRTVETLHFILQGQDEIKLRKTGNLCEEIYKKIMFDTNLFSFKPRQNYLLVIYRDQMEYHLKTGYPLWSGGGTVTKLLGQTLSEDQRDVARTSIYTSEDVTSHALLAHEIAHLIFNEFMDFKTGKDADAVRWVNEGLATYEELEGYKKVEREEFLKVTAPLLKQNPIPLRDSMKFKPLKEEVKVLGNYFFRDNSIAFTNIDLWYWQARNVIKFLIEKQGQYNFYLLLNALKQGKDFISALNDAYPGKWASLEGLETEWRQSF